MIMFLLITLMVILTWLAVETALAILDGLTKDNNK